MVFLANFRVPAFGGRPELSVIGLAFMTVVICDRLTVWVLIFMFFFFHLSVVRLVKMDGMLLAGAWRGAFTSIFPAWRERGFVLG